MSYGQGKADDVSTVRLLGYAYFLKGVWPGKANKCRDPYFLYFRDSGFPNPALIPKQRNPPQTKRVSSCLAGGEGLLGSELLQFCQNAAHEHAVGEGEAVARARRRQGVVDEEAAALGIANRIQAIDDLVLGVEHFEINGGFKAA